MIAPVNRRRSLEDVLDDPYFFPFSSEHDEALLFHGEFAGIADQNQDQEEARQIEEKI